MPRYKNEGKSYLNLAIGCTGGKHRSVVITNETEVEFKPEGVEVEDEHILEVTYEDIGGLDEEIKKIREMVELPLKHPEIFERLGVEAPKGVVPLSWIPVFINASLS